MERNALFVLTIIMTPNDFKTVAWGFKTRQKIMENLRQLYPGNWQDLDHRKSDLQILGHGLAD